MQNTSKIILGIDPGTVVMGFGIIKVDLQKASVVDMGVLKLSSRLDSYERLYQIHHRVQGIIQEFKPHYFAIEAPFYGKNVQSMLKLGRAQGVAIAAAIEAGLEVCEYSPKRVKQSITGNGNAAKEQVMSMLEKLLNFTYAKFPLDASDALAVALCHHFQIQSPLPPAGKSAKNWDDFLKNNPERLAQK